MAETALQYGDWCFFTSDNPRTENPKDILADMTTGLKDTHYSVIEDRKEAIKAAVSRAEKGDVVLIAGKGHETFQQIGLTKLLFDDRKAAKEAIENKEL
ncbi:UDP-N-acetylmuramoyl-L-alanyl-D-glutamate--2,6-diaminopimelate ligase [Lentibacillus sp. JNUCC-1]|nr:UDP-N-acetylmuramoyl-L-alanyl-D-glutamate--2,6-diaminopimelate ligase [Lentibacillus sp. JNUCC-1]